MIPNPAFNPQQSVLLVKSIMIWSLMSVKAPQKIIISIVIFCSADVHHLSATILCSLESRFLSGAHSCPYERNYCRYYSLFLIVEWLVSFRWVNLPFILPKLICSCSILIKNFNNQSNSSSFFLLSVVALTAVIAAAAASSDSIFYDWWQSFPGYNRRI